VTTKSEDATPKRRKKAQEDGDSGQSAFFAQSLTLVVAITLLPGVAEQIRDGFARDLSEVLSARPLGLPAEFVALRVLRLALPLLAVCAVVSGLALLVQTGGVLATKQLAPKFETLNPVTGLRKLLSGPRFVSVLRALGLSLLAALIATRVLRGALPDLRNLTGNLAASSSVAGVLVLRILKPIAWISLGFSVLDLAYQKWSWNNRIKMSKDEVKREHKESEGDPQFKAAREQAHHELVNQAVLHNVKKATVVVVNPTHIACAIRYIDGEDNAPVVVGSGEGELAERIMRVARENGIPILRNVPLARALREVDLDAEIPEVLFEAVAEILRDLQEEEAART
jgi:flagellar biosynthesis protein FlhB